MSYYWGRRYVPVAERRAKAARKAAQLEKTYGRKLKPIAIEGRTISRTFWGKAWSRNLEQYSDYANRLPRGRTYARNGSVIDLLVSKGRVHALVSGSSLYTVQIRIDPLPEERWAALRLACVGEISSLVELLQGKLSRSVMEIVSRPGQGLFPSPKEIHLSCSCPDWAVMCKHVAASLYGVAARLDHAPEKLFELRGVDPVELIPEAFVATQMARRPSRSRLLEVDDLSSIFGVDIDFSEAPLPSPGRPKARKARRTAPKKTAPKKKAATKKAATKKAATTKKTAPTKKAVPTKKAATTKKTAPTKKAVPKPRLALRNLSEAALEVFALIESEPGLRTPALAERLGRTRSQVTSAIAVLKKRRLVHFVGPRNSGGYESTGRA